MKITQCKLSSQSPGYNAVYFVWWLAKLWRNSYVSILCLEEWSSSSLL